MTLPTISSLPPSYAEIYGEMAPPLIPSPLSSLRIQTNSYISDTAQQEPCTRRFFCRWDNLRSQYCHNGTGVGYIGNANESLWESFHYGVHLSFLLDGQLVFGINYEKEFFAKEPISERLSVHELVECWREFFDIHEGGRFIQYFYGNGGTIVEQALKFSRFSRWICVVGINPCKVLNHEPALYYRSWGDFHSRNVRDQVVTLPLNPDTDSLFFPSFSDVTFFSAIQHAYYRVLRFAPPVLLSKHWPISQEIQLILGDPKLCKTLGERVQYFDESQWLQQSVQKCLSSEERVRASTAERVWASLNSCLHILNFTELFARSRLPLSKYTKEQWHIQVFLKRIFVKRKLVQDIFNSKGEPVIRDPNINVSSYISGEFPRDIYPCGIMPNGSMPIGRGGPFVRGAFSYSKYFSMQLMPMDLVEPYYHPYGLKAGGAFHLRTNQIRWPYAFLSYEYIQAFNHSIFFSGGMIGLEGTEFQEVLYPCGITPNGTFTGHYLGFEPAYSHPYGFFPDNNFPYKSFFFGNFNYEQAFIENHSKMRSNVVGESTRPEGILTTYEQFYHRQLAKLHATQQLQQTLYLAILGYWMLYSLAQAMLVLSHRSGYHRRLRTLALGFTSSVYIAHIGTLINNFMTYTEEDRIIHVTIGVGSGVPVIYEALTRFLPYVRSQVQSLEGIEVPSIQGCRRRFAQAGKEMKRVLPRAAILVSILKAIYTVCVGLGQSVASFFDFELRYLSSDQAHSLCVMNSTHLGLKIIIFLTIFFIVFRILASN